LAINAGRGKVDENHPSTFFLRFHCGYTTCQAEGFEIWFGALSFGASLFVLALMSRRALREVEPNTAFSAQSLIRQIVKPAHAQPEQALHARSAQATSRPVAAAAGVASISARLSGSSSFVQHAGSVAERSARTDFSEASQASTRAAAASRYELSSGHESTVYREMANRTRSLQAAGRTSRAISSAGSASVFLANSFAVRCYAIAKC
jgi:hypothetical protein